MEVKLLPNNNMQITDALVTYVNLSGAASQVNQEGNRNFAVIVDDPDSERIMLNAGLTLRPFVVNEEERGKLVNVKLNYGGYKRPNANLVIDGVTTPLSEDTVGSVDDMDIGYVDMVVNLYNWTVHQKSGVKPYVTTMYINVIPDELFTKYHGNNPTLAEQGLCHDGIC